MLIHPVTSVEILVMITEIVPKKLTWSLRMIGRTWKQKGHLKANAQIVIVHTRGFALVKGPCSPFPCIVIKIVIDDTLRLHVKL